MLPAVIHCYHVSKNQRKSDCRLVRDQIRTLKPQNQIKMKQSVSFLRSPSLISVVRTISLVFFSVSMLFVACSKKDKVEGPPAAAFAGNYLVVDDNDTYILQIENTGGNNFEISEFAGFMNVPINATGSGNTLTIPAQTFTNSSGHSITISGTGALSGDDITFNYSVAGFVAYDGSFTGKRQ
jgi:hypothetical protein